MSREAFHFPSESRSPISAYLPPSPPATSPPSHESTPPKPFVTLTFATSLDSALALAPGTQTALSGPQSKAMTHFLRSQHDAILIGVGTALADNPSLNCRLEGVGVEGQPRPVVVDPAGRWEVMGGEERGRGGETKTVGLAREGRGRAPWVVVGREVDENQRKSLEEKGGKYVVVEGEREGRMGWRKILEKLGEMSVGSVMIEGGWQVINALLEEENKELVDSVIVTVAPVWLGKGGVVVSPERSKSTAAVARLGDVKWVPLGEDVVLCGRIK